MNSLNWEVVWNFEEDAEIRVEAVLYSVEIPGAGAQQHHHESFGQHARADRSLPTGDLLQR